MRLSCPNCAAQYEVDDRLIPAGGRDVQCSACGHAWFFLPGPEEGGLVPPPATSAPAAAPAAAAAAAPAGTSPAAAAGPPGATAPAARPAAGSDATVATAAAPRRPGLDPAVTEVLRAEAEREARARRAEAAAIESQPDLGLPEAAARPRPAAAPSSPAPTPAPSPAPAAPGAGAAAGPSRRDRLPDIEEINSTLRPAGDRQGRTAAPPAAAGAVAPAGRGFRLGVALVVLVTLAALAVYLYAPAIVAALPAAEAPLAAYVAAVDAARLWLHGVVAGLRGEGGV